MESIGDLSKIIGVIMENPELIGKIRSLAQNDADGKEAKADPAADEKAQESEAVMKETSDKDTKEASVLIKSGGAKESHREKRKHRELLCALKPYVSKERAKTIDTFVSVIEIVGLMKAGQ